ncbi:hypothetical protein ACIQI7_14480 [Kitasatospora sp. NPDC092039]|uniref:hypothetical protein n=1 Tax=Kitasatospora sp. NPDC092039 TaxID=3364086 RepID=UPI0037FFC8C4
MAAGIRPSSKVIRPGIEPQAEQALVRLHRQGVSRSTRNAVHCPSNVAKTWKRSAVCAKPFHFLVPRRTTSAPSAIRRGPDGGGVTADVRLGQGEGRQRFTPGGRSASIRSYLARLTSQFSVAFSTTKSASA